MPSRPRIVLTLGLIAIPGQLLPSDITRGPNQAARTTGLAIPVELAVRIADGRTQFRPGEIIPIELEFNSSTAKRFVVDGATYDRSGRLTIDEFQIDPLEAVSDPMLDYFASRGGSIGGGVRSMGVLGEKPFTVRLELNDWFRFDKAGAYRLKVRSHRVTDEAHAGDPKRSILPLDSNIVSFEILPRDPDWEAAALGEALRILESQASGGDSRRGCRILRFLASDAAVDEMIRRYEGQSVCDFEYMAGLFTSPNRDRVVRQLEAGLRAHDQAVTQSYLRTLAALSIYAEHPEFRPLQSSDTKGRMVPPGELGLNRDLIQAAEAKYVDILMEALPAKSERARAITLAARLEFSPRRSSTIPSGPDAARARLRDDVAATFLALPTERQVDLLEYQWHAIASASMVPILRRLAESPTSSPALTDLALRRLYGLAPEEGRPHILRNVRNPPSGASLKTLGLLPDRELPELDDILTANVEQHIATSESFDALAIRTELLERYASARPAVRLLSSIGDALTGMACRPQSALLAYFLRADAVIGSMLVDRALDARDGTTGCYKSALSAIAKLCMTPALETAAIARLDDPDPQVIVSAADTLRQYGSSAAQQPLRAQFERWQTVWKGRQDELRASRAQNRSGMQAMVEFSFLQALARGQGWLTDRAGIEDLRALCVTDDCRTQARYMMDSADGTRIQIVRLESRDDALVMVAQYQLGSITALEQKLTQYPPGTSFTLDLSALEPQVASVTKSEIIRFAESHNLRIAR